MLIGEAQIVGHLQLWSRIFSNFNLKIDANLVRHLKRKDENKRERQKQQKTVEYKARRSSNRYKKFAEAHSSQLADVKTGATYESGIAVKNAKKTLKEAPKRNPNGTLPSEWKCPYYHTKYCNTMGHRDCRTSICHMHDKTKLERDEALAYIMKEAIELAVKKNADSGKQYCNIFLLILKLSCL